MRRPPCLGPELRRTSCYRGDQHERESSDSDSIPKNCRDHPAQIEKAVIWRNPVDRQRRNFSPRMSGWKLNRLEIPLCLMLLFFRMRTYCSVVLAGLRGRRHRITHSDTTLLDLR